MRTPFTLAVTDSLDGNQLGSLCDYLLADNPTGQWWYERNANQWIPPYTMGMILRFDVATQAANLHPLTPPGCFSAPLPGQQAYFAYFDATVLKPMTAAGGGGQGNPAGAPQPDIPAIPADMGSDMRGPADIIPLSPTGTGMGGYAQTEGTPRQPAPLARASVPVAGTPLGLLPGLPATHAQIDGMTLIPHDEQGRIVYGDSFERTAPEKLWTGAGATVAGTDTWALSGEKSLLVTQTGAADGTAQRTFPLPRYGGNVGVEVTFDGDFGTGPDSAYLLLLVRNGVAEQTFGVRMNANQPQYFDALGAADWVDINFPLAVTGGVLNNVGDVTKLTTMKVVFQNKANGLAYSHVVINGYVFNLWDADKVEDTGAHTTPAIDVQLGISGDTKAMPFDDVKITSNEGGNFPTSRTLGIAD